MNFWELSPRIKFQNWTFLNALIFSFLWPLTFSIVRLGHIYHFHSLINTFYIYIYISEMHFSNSLVDTRRNFDAVINLNSQTKLWLDSIFHVCWKWPFLAYLTLIYMRYVCFYSFENFWHMRMISSCLIGFIDHNWIVQIWWCCSSKISTFINHTSKDYLLLWFFKGRASIISLWYW